MKHPALSRVFAVILAALSLLSVLCGLAGFGDAKQDMEAAVAYCDRLDSRKEKLISLREEVSGAVPYEDANSELKQMREQHDTDASQHKTDVAVYSATKGGYTMGADQLWEAKAQLAGAKQQLESAKSQFAAMDAMKAAMQNSIAECDAASADCAKSAGEVSALLASLGGVMKDKPEEPKQPEAPKEPQEPEAPKEPQKPEEPKAPDPIGEDASEEEKAAYESAMLKYQADYAKYQIDCEQYLKDLDEYPAKKLEYDEKYKAYLKDKEQYDTVDKPKYDADMILYQDRVQKYPAEYAQWQLRFYGALQGANVGAWLSSLEKGSAAINNASAILPDDMKDSLGGADMGGIGDIGGFDPSTMTPEQIYGALSMLGNGLNQMSGGLAALSAGLSGGIAEMDNQVAESVNQLSGGELQIAPGTDSGTIIAMLEKMISSGEAKIESGLADVWYGLGQLEEDKQELAEKKEQLDAESRVLSEKSAAAGQIKENEDDLTSMRIILMNVDGIKSRVDDGADIADATEAYIAEYMSQTQTKNGALKLFSLIMTVGGVLGVLAVIPAFEIVKKRFVLVALPLACLVCSAGAAVLGYCGYGGNVQRYVAVVTAVFALIQTLVVFPKEKA